MTTSSTSWPVWVLPGGTTPARQHEDDAGFDLWTAESVDVPPRGITRVDLGFASAIPAGCVGLVFARSSLPVKHGLTLANAVGVIDSGYRGAVKAALLNLTDNPVHVPTGVRVAQMVHVRVEPVRLELTNELPDTERGAGGFGSTGGA